MMPSAAIDMLGVAAAIEAARDTGLLRALATRNGTPHEYACELHLDRGAVARVLDVLATANVAVRKAGRYTAAPELSSFAAMPGGVEEQLELWRHVTDFLRTGEPLARMDAAAPEREASYRCVVAGLGEIFTAPARQLASRLDRAPRHILDVGCGSGVWSLAIAERCTNTRVTGLDLPAVLTAFAARAEVLGLGDRIELLPGDMHVVDLAINRFDLAVIANVLRLEPQEHAARLISRVAAALRPGGELVIVDALAQGTPERERSRAVYALHLALRTTSGRVHPAEEIAAWLRHAGLNDIRVVELDSYAGAVGALLARVRTST